MKGKKSQYVLIMISAMILFLMTVSSFFCINDQSKSWIGSYSFEEFAPGSFRKNEFRDYSITIYEDNGLYARIKIDGYKIFERMTAKVWTHHDEIWLTFYEYYVDEEGNSSVPETYKEGYQLIRMKKAGDAIITEWCGIEPLLFGNEEPGEYFTKDKNLWLLAWESFLPRYILHGLIMISEVILFFMAVRHFLGLNNQSKSWIGSYSFEESAPPDRNRNYSITIYEDHGLYARIKIDGYKILERMTAKVWTHHDEIWLTFHEYYVDEEGKSSMLEKYGEGYTLVRMRMEGDVLITNWYLMRPLLIENQKPGQYFTKDKKWGNRDDL
jgi:hypothetical protein